MADVQVKRKIGVSPHARITTYSSTPNSPTRSSRPVSPSKHRQLQSASTAPEQLWPRAKISSAAIGARNEKVPSTGAVYSSRSTTPRAPSPIRRQSSQQEGGRTSPKLSIRTLSRVRSKAALSAISAPSSPRVGSVKAQYASLSATTSGSALSKTSPPRVRKPSLSSVSQLSVATNGVCSPPLSAVSYSRDSDTQSTVSTARVKAKVSSLAKGKPPAYAQPIPSPLLMPSPMLDRSMSQAQASSPSTGSHVRQRLPRTASISSLSAPPTPPQVYPITTASPAANVHRYATFRSPSYTHRATPSFTSPLQADHKPPAQSNSSSLAPPPPLSPPVSNASFSSQSSLSHPSLTPVNHVSSANVHANGDEHRRNPSASFVINGLNERVKSRSNSFVTHDMDPHPLRRADSSEPDVYQDIEERTIMAEAKSHRKIADLEITNKSLLAINSQLETNKHKQAKEIRDLRRKLRQSQLALPPRTYRELKASGDAIENDRDEEELLEEQGVDGDGDEEARWNAEAVRLGKDDVIFDRVRLILESLLTTGKQALALKVEDLAPPKGAAKVLHEVEARTWREGTSRGASGVATPAAGDPTDDVPLDDSSSESDCGVATSQRIGDQSLQRNDSRRSEREMDELIGNLNSSLSTSLRA